MPIINSLIAWLMKKRIHQIELFKKYPSEVQHELLLRLIGQAKNTKWGEEYNYKNLDSLAAFKETVPVQDYEDIQPYVLRMKEGEKNLLWPGETRWFAKSSGTTSAKSKFIPLTKEALEECHFKGGKDMLSIYCNNNPDTQIFNGKGLTLGGSKQINQFNSESYYGDLSAILINNLPFWAQVMRTPDSSIALMEDYEEKLEKMATVTLTEDVTSIAGVPSWTLVLLNKILNLTNRSSIKEIWPNLEVYFHGAVNFGPYRQEYAQVIGKDINYLELYNASEGFFGIQDQVASSEMLLMLDYGIYYEFLPVDEPESKFPRTLSLDEVELNTNYALIITTNAGLWRYKLGDTIKFTSLRPYRIEISGRTKHFINAVGEELIVDNAERAISRTCEKTGCLISEYTAAPIYPTKTAAGRHEWLIEFSKEPADLNHFTEVLDEELKALNSDYEAKRTGNMTLDRPLVIPVESGTFYEWMKKRGKLGGQHKVPRLFNGRKYIDEIKTHVMT
jgi:hypothetical protein